jgi:hypothetical protein
MYILGTITPREYMKKRDKRTEVAGNQRKRGEEVRIEKIQTIQ